MLRNTFLFVLICSISQVFSQSGATVKGFLYDKANGEPIPFSSVYFKGTGIGANTDLNGFFSINRIPPGAYTLLVTNLEYDTIRETITVKEGDLIAKKLFATKGGVKLEEIEITTVAAEKIENTNVAVQQIDPIVISKLPSVGEPDLAQFLQVLPGVVFTGDQGGQLYIRGGLPVQNKVLLDGLIVYNPFHSIGLFSVFDNDIMKNADVYSAGFNAEYGGRTSSIMDITTRDGNKKHFAGKASVSTFGAKAVVEGPLMKLDEEGNTSASYVFSAKHSYLPTTSKVLYPYASENGLPFYYTDLYGKASINSTNGSKFSLFGFSFNDKVDYSDIESYAWKNIGAGANFVMVPSNANLLIEGVFAFSKYNIKVENPQDPRQNKTSGISGVNTGFTFVKFMGLQELRYGFEGITTNTNYNLSNPFGASLGLSRSTIDVATFVKYKYLGKNRRIVLEPGFRLQYYATVGVLSPEPRFAFKYNITKRIRLKGAAGLYSQTLMSASNDRDVVNLFYGFINAPEIQDMSRSYIDYKGQEQEINNSVQKATHVVGGVEIDIFKHFELNVETYQKFFNQVININRDKAYEDNSSNEDRPDEVKKVFVVEQGRARGLDFVLKYDRKRFYFWAIYSITFNDRWVSNSLTHKLYNYPPTFDRRHNVNLVTSYSFGKKRQWEVNGRWNFGTGFPFTQTQGYYNQIRPNGNIWSEFSNANGTLNYIPADLNQGRLPDFHRLDIGIKHRYKINERSTFETSFGITNVYNRANIFQVDRYTFKRKDQLPFLPNLNVSLSF
jgi:hypothetical protein